MTDPIAQFIRSERAASLATAPPAHAARVWHAARRRRATALRRLTMAIGWALLAVLAAATAVTALWWKADTPFLLALLGLFAWLTRYACAGSRA